jgi:hypothetical protein
MKKLGFILLIFMLQMHFLWSQEVKHLVGSVEGQDGEPIPGVHLYFDKGSGSGTLSDTNGLFHLKYIASDSLGQLLVSAIGFKKQVIQFQELQPTDSLKIVLQEEIIAVDGLVVRESRLLAEELNQVEMKQLDVYRNPAAQGDPLLAVNSSPFSTQTDESANIRLRGALPGETAVILNGVPLQDPIRYQQLDGLGTFSILNNSLIDNLRVFAGAVPFDYGSHPAGAVSLESRTEYPSQIQSEIQLSLAGSGLMISKTINDQFGFRVFGNVQYSGLFKALNSEALQEVEHFNSADAGFQSSWKKGKNEIRLFHLFNHDLYRLSDGGFQGNNFEQNKRQHQTVFNFIHRSGKHEFSYNQGFSLRDQSLLFPDARLNLNSQHLFTSINYQQTARKAQFKTGFVADLRRQDFFRPDNDMVVNSRSEIARWEAYLYRKRDFGDRWSLSTGFSVDQNLRFNSNSSILYRPFNELECRFSYHQVQRNYLPTRVFPEVYKLHSRSLSLDLDYRKGNWQLQAGIYQRWSRYQEEKIPIRGMEFLQKYQNQQFSVQFGFSMMQPLAKTSNLVLNQELAGFDYFLRSGINWKIGSGFELNSNLVYRQGNFYLPDHAIQLTGLPPGHHLTRLPDYSRIDFSLSKMLLLFNRMPVVVFTSLNNVLNTHNIRAYSATGNQAPLYYQRRVFYFGLNLNL